MIDIDFTKIDNAKMIGRLLPFWARGRKITLLLHALFSPFKAIHSAFRAWALERYVFCHITAQAPSIAWYLRYKLKDRIQADDGQFRVVSGLEECVSCFSAEKWWGHLYWRGDLKWGQMPPGEYTEDDLRYSDDIVVHAPAIKGGVNYTEDDYKREIRALMSKFMISLKRIIIIIEQN